MVVTGRENVHTLPVPVINNMILPLSGFSFVQESGRYLQHRTGAPTSVGDASGADW